MASESSAAVIGTTSMMTDGERRLVEFSGQKIALFNVNGTVFALQNRCPHKGGPLCRGRVRPLVVECGNSSFEYEREGEIVKCPWHQWEFELSTGQAICDPKVRVKTFTVTQQGLELVIT